MRLLYRCQGITGLPAIRSGMSLVWGSVYPQAWADGLASRTYIASQKKSPSRLDEIRPQRNGVAPIGESAGLFRTGWPGREIGVRAPEQDETPLSAAEVVYLLPSYWVRCNTAVVRPEGSERTQS